MSALSSGHVEDHDGLLKVIISEKKAQRPTLVVSNLSPPNEELPLGGNNIVDRLNGVEHQYGGRRFP
ncbi:hypothetical protein PanWU01x14_024350 [Parasponia andersonii]|uniref:Uncharacterized protein n=1 Tax=Parasponia andersonii TaxID=3476 RepID=A0A2P5DWN6_PARAD|nr:hypothetical protein PanWU01x14_024350 [Parasponia andersonii]